MPRKQTTDEQSDSGTEPQGLGAVKVNKNDEAARISLDEAARNTLSQDLVDAINRVDVLHEEVKIGIECGPFKAALEGRGKKSALVILIAWIVLAVTVSVWGRDWPLALRNVIPEAPAKVAKQIPASRAPVNPREK